jgi:hypothetical protein
MTKEKLQLLHTKVEEYKREWPEGVVLREGQSLMNCLHDVDVDTYLLVTNTIYDPFYKDEVIPIFLSYLESICVD